MPEINQITVLGKMNTFRSGKAPPVLVRMENEKEAKAVLRAAKKLSQIKELRNVYIAADLDTESRAKRKKLREELKKKIKDSPQQHWIIREGEVKSVGEHTPRVILDNGDEEDDWNKSFNF